jgi:hypothetical protein
MRTWNFTVGGSTHTVQIAHDPIFSGELEIYLDGKKKVQDIVSGGENFEYKCVIEGRLCLVRILFSSMRSGSVASSSCTYEVIVDGKPQEYSGVQDLVPLPSDSMEQAKSSVMQTSIQPRQVDIVPPAIEAQVRELVAQHKTIDAIKLVRQYVDLGLGEALDYVKHLD